MFITTAYFTGEINIPNLSGTNSNFVSVGNAIEQYEKEILIQLLGYKLYSLLVADLNDQMLPRSEKYIKLVNGAEFTHVWQGEEITLKWEGFKGDNNKRSLLAYYTFYKYIEREVTHLTNAGIVLTPSMKGIRASSENKMIAAWERMRELYGKITPEYKKYFGSAAKGSNLPCTFNCDASAYNFLYANKSDYPDWYFTPQWNINALGI